MENFNLEYNIFVVAEENIVENVSKNIELETSEAEIIEDEIRNRNI